MFVPGKKCISFGQAYALSSGQYKLEKVQSCYFKLTVGSKDGKLVAYCSLFSGVQCICCNPPYPASSISGSYICVVSELQYILADNIILNKYLYSFMNKKANWTKLEYLDCNRIISIYYSEKQHQYLTTSILLHYLQVCGRYNRRVTQATSYAPCCPINRELFFGSVSSHRSTIVAALRGGRIDWCGALLFLFSFRFLFVDWRMQQLELFFLEAYVEIL